MLRSPSGPCSSFRGTAKSPVTMETVRPAWAMERAASRTLSGGEWVPTWEALMQTAS